MEREFGIGFVALLVLVVLLVSISQLYSGGGVEPLALMGDLDGDGCVTNLDTGIALEIAIGNLAPSPYQMAVGDMNGDKRINSADVALIRREVGKCL